MPSEVTIAQSQLSSIEHPVIGIDVQMPFDPDDANDSEFLKHLLLSHGLELELDEQGVLGYRNYQQLVDSASNADGFDTSIAWDVTDEFTLSLWSEPNEPTQVDAQQSSTDSNFRVVWWQVSPRYLSPETLDSAAVGELPLREDAERSLMNSLGNPVVESLADRLRSSGIEADFGEGCMPSANQAMRIHDWLERGKIPPYYPSINRAPELLVDVFDSNVSREWRVIWLDCPDGVTLVRLPPGSFEPDPASAQAAELIAQSKLAIPGAPEQTQSSARGHRVTDSAPASDVQSPAAVNQAAPAPDVGSPFINNRTEPTVSDRPNSLVQLNDDVPAGFEALAGPQFVFIDIYFNDQLVGSTGVMASPEEVVFDNPAEVAEFINDSVSSDQLVNWLSEPLPSNGHLSCFAENDPEGCGQLTGDPLAIIYNEMFLRIDLFVNQSQQTVNKQQRQRHLPSPDRRNTAILSVSALASEFEGSGSSVDLSGRALLGYGRGHVTAEADYSEQEDRKRLRELKLTHYLNDYELAIGTYAYHTGGGLPDVDLIGAGFGTSFKTRVDLEHAFSSQLVVYLNNRSIVQLVIADRIYAGDSYPAGNQVLNTAGLPDGTYEVELRIIDSVTGTRSERRIFTKSTQIPPHGEPVVSFTAGSARQADNEFSIPIASEVNVAGVSYTQRLTDQSAYRLGLLQFGSHAFAQTEFLYIGSSLSYQLTASAGGAGTLSAGVQAGFKISDIAFSLSGDHYVSEFQAVEGSVQSTFFLSDFSQVSLSVNRAFESFSLGARTSFRRETEEDDSAPLTKQHSIFAQKPLFKRSGTRGYVGTRYQHSEQEQRAEVSMSVFFGNRSWSGSLGSRWADANQTESQLHSNASLGWRSPVTSNGSLSSDAYIEYSEDSSSTGARIELEHPWFLANATTDKSMDHRQDASTRNTVASVSAHFGVDRRGAGMGGSDYAQAGVIIDVSGEPEGAEFDVMIDNILTSTGKVGQQQFIGLQPFRRYELKLVPKTMLGNGLADGVHNFTLFPGGVQRITIEARRQLLLIASIVDTEGDYIVDALIQSERNTLIVGEDSILQAEVFAGEVMSVRLSDGSTCSITVPDDTVDDVVIPDEPMVCQLDQ
ncbi:MAG: TcfC E-set like domain-containing protein [Granulosicoccus sp.]